MVKLYKYLSVCNIDIYSTFFNDHFLLFAILRRVEKSEKVFHKPKQYQQGFVNKKTTKTLHRINYLLSNLFFKTSGITSIWGVPLDKNQSDGP